MTQALDLEAELAAGAETPKNDAADAAPAGATDLSAVLDTAAKRQGLAKLVAQLKRVMRTLNDGDAAKAARLTLKALDTAPDNALANHIMGICLQKLGRLSTALTFYERAWKADPKNPEIYLNMGMVAWKLDMLEHAEKFFRIFSEMAPKRIEAAINLGGALRDQGRFSDSIEILRAAVYARPEEPALWNALGTTLLEAGDPDQAGVFYEECLRLRPDFARAHHNLAYTLEMRGEAERAVEHFQQALTNPDSPRDRVAMTHALSLACLASGELQRGWDLYSVRLDPLYDDATLYAIAPPRWDGADPSEIAGKTLLVIGEQGLGDEVLFLNTLGAVIDAVGPDGEVRVACEPRLRPLVERAYPQAVVGRHRTIAREGREIRSAPEMLEDGQVDLWTPMGSPARAFRTRIDAFPAEPHFCADPDRVAAFAEQLAGFGPGPKVGLLWKSLKMTAKRAKAFSAFEGWAPVLKTPGAVFVNLQYGEVDEELEQARARFGVELHQPEGLDLKDDLDGVAALCKACDIVMGPMNATTNLAASVGAETWIVHARRRTWTMLGADALPWYPTARSYAGAGYRDFAGALKAVAADLAARTVRAGAA